MKSFTPIQKSYIWLDSFEELTAKTLFTLIQKFNSSTELVKCFKKEKDFISQLTGLPLYNKMCGMLNPEYLQPLLDKLILKEVGVITAEDENYPSELLQYDDKPFILYTLGDTALLKTPLITVVGSRRCTRYGIEQTKIIVKGLCDYGFTIVSGLAEGIDTAANTQALESGKTIAVIAGGFDHIYPAMNENLFYEIAQKGLIISQYPPHTEIKPYMFPLRNRIMASLGNATVITEAGEASGAMITANLTLNLGKELFVLPGNVNSPSSIGTNRLIKEMQGAIITSYEDILNSFGIEIKKEEIKVEHSKELSEDERKIINMLKKQDEHIDDIISKTGVNIKKINAILTIMEIKGFIKKLPGNRFGV